MTERQLSIITGYAVEFLAEKHGTTTKAVTDAIQAGHEKLAQQFAKLVAVGIKTAAGL